MRVLGLGSSAVVSLAPSCCSSFCGSSSATSTSSNDRHQSGSAAVRVDQRERVPRCESVRAPALRASRCPSSSRGATGPDDWARGTVARPIVKACECGLRPRGGDRRPLPIAQQIERRHRRSPTMHSVNSQEPTPLQLIVHPLPGPASAQLPCPSHSTSQAPPSHTKSQAPAPLQSHAKAAAGAAHVARALALAGQRTRPAVDVDGGRRPLETSSKPAQNVGRLTTAYAHAASGRGRRPTTGR